jgi:hypothetical protein
MGSGGSAASPYVIDPSELLARVDRYGIVFPNGGVSSLRTHISTDPGQRCLDVVEIDEPPEEEP